MRQRRTNEMPNCAEANQIRERRKASHASRRQNYSTSAYTRRSWLARRSPARKSAIENKNVKNLKGEYRRGAALQKPRLPFGPQSPAHTRRLQVDPTHLEVVIF